MDDLRALRSCQADPLASPREGRCFQGSPHLRSPWKEHKKNRVLGEITEAWKNVASIVIADYRGIKVPVVTAMRDDFRKGGLPLPRDQELARQDRGERFQDGADHAAHVGHHGRDLDDRRGRRSRPRRSRSSGPRTEPKLKILWAATTRARSSTWPASRMLSKMPTKNDIRASMLMTFLAGPQCVRRAGSRRRFKTLPTSWMRASATSREVPLTNRKTVHTTPTTFSKPIGF